MRRTISAVALLTVVSASCGCSALSGGLSDAEFVWCDRNSADVISAGQTLGLVNHPMEAKVNAEAAAGPDGRVLESVVADGVRYYVFTSGEYQRACRAAFEGRSASAPMPTSTLPSTTLPTIARTTTLPVPLKEKLAALPFDQWTEAELKQLNRADREDLYLTITRSILSPLGVPPTSDHDLLAGGNRICISLARYEGNIGELAWDYGLSLVGLDPEEAQARLNFLSATSPAAAVLCPQWYDEIALSYRTWTPPSG